MHLVPVIIIQQVWTSDSPFPFIFLPFIKSFSVIFFFLFRFFHFYFLHRFVYSFKRKRSVTVRSAWFMLAWLQKIDDEETKEKWIWQSHNSRSTKSMNSLRLIYYPFEKLNMSLQKWNDQHEPIKWGTNWI